MRARGERYKAGGMVVKNVSGYQIWKLLAGSHGALGFVLRANFKLRPIPERRLARAAVFRDHEEAHAFAAAVREHRLEPAALFVVESSSGEPMATWVWEGNAPTVAWQDQQACDLLAGRSAQLVDAVEEPQARTFLRRLASIAFPGTTPPPGLGIAQLSLLPSRVSAVSQDILSALEKTQDGGELVRASDAMTGLLTLRWRIPEKDDAGADRILPILSRSLARENKSNPAAGTVLYLPSQARRKIVSPLHAFPAEGLARRIEAAFHT